jgi:hypothetical protein
LATAETFPVGVEISWSHGAIASAEASLEAHGVLLLGEFHGVAENLGPRRFMTLNRHRRYRTSHWRSRLKQRCSATVALHEARAERLA